jgi:DnaK suppressor protein
MATTKRTTAAANSGRSHELKKVLEDRRRELMHEVHGRIRGFRSDISKNRQVLDLGETSEADIQEDIEFALIQMQAETLNKIDAALGRFDEGTYGLCFECGAEIPERRLRALPFAVRCKDCEEDREKAKPRGRTDTLQGSLRGR